jgi:leucyl/phenylalanyl-tRNA--protein transferase
VAVCRPTPAVEPPSTRWIFPSTPPEEIVALADGPDDELVPGRPAEVVGIGADLEPGTLLRAYRSGVFPMPVRRGLMAWWSPEPRGVIPLSGLKITRSLRRSCSKFTIRVDTAFEEVISACGDANRKGAWIDRDVEAAYLRLHHWGWAHSVEAWDDYGRLAGGLYGVAIGGFFAGESMFHRQNDASKVALVGLVELLQAAGARLLDVQWATPHLKSLGAAEVSRAQYLDRLGEAVLLPQPAAFGGSPFLPVRGEVGGLEPSR